MKKVEEGWQNNSRWGKNTTRCQLVLMNFFIRATFMLLFYIQSHHFTQNHSFLIVHSERKVIITCNSWLTSYPYTSLWFLPEAFVLINILRFHCQFVVCSGKFWHFRILERLTNWWMSQYVFINTINTITPWKVLCMVFTHSFLYQKSHSFTVLTHSISDMS